MIRVIVLPSCIATIKENGNATIAYQVQTQLNLWIKGVTAIPPVTWEYRLSDQNDETWNLICSHQLDFAELKDLIEYIKKMIPPEHLVYTMNIP